MSEEINNESNASVKILKKAATPRKNTGNSFFANCCKGIKGNLSENSNSSGSDDSSSNTSDDLSLGLSLSDHSSTMYQKKDKHI
jgi:hypothetical protein